MTARPFHVLGVQQIALGSLDRRVLEALWVDCLGASLQATFQSASENVDEAVLSLGRGLGRVEVDLMQPLDPNARPSVHAPALHHVGLWIDDLRVAVMWLVLHGVRFTRGGIRRGASGHDVCFVHPKPSSFFPLCGQGVLIELVQAPGELIRQYWAAGGEHGSRELSVPCFTVATETTNLSISGNPPRDLRGLEGTEEALDRGSHGSPRE